MKLKPEEQDALKDYVGRVFDAGVVTYGKYLKIPIEVMFDLGESLKKASPRIEKLHRGKGLHDLTKNSLFSLIDVDASSDRDSALSACMSLSRQDAIDTVVNDLTSSLPRLLFVFPLPKTWVESLETTLGLPTRAIRAALPAKAFFEQTKIIPVSGSVRLRIFRPQSLLGIRLTDDQARDYLSGKGGLVVQGEGLHGAYATEALDEATDLAAAIYATLAVYGLLQFKPNWDPSEIYVPVFQRLDSKLEIWDTPRRRPDLSEFEHRFGPSEKLLSKDEAVALKRALLIVMSTIKEAAPISLALYWLFRTFLDRSRQEDILDVAICLEILAGSRATKDDPSISSSIAHKIAYALATGYHERAGIEKTIKAFYGLRSAVIHAGKRRLTNEEDVLVFSATEYCKRFIRHEISVLAEDLDWDHLPDAALSSAAADKGAAAASSSNSKTT